MASSRKPTTAKRLREVLDYNRTTGVLRWKKQLSNRVKIGDVAGSVDQGYLRICIDGEAYFAHRLAWLHVHGRWPTEQTDHRNLKRSDNRLSNLREATCGQNRRNTKFLAKSGFKGAYPYGNRFRAAIRLCGKMIYLGIFDTAELANDAYAKKAKEHFGEFARA